MLCCKVMFFNVIKLVRVSERIHFAILFDYIYSLCVCLGVHRSGKVKVSPFGWMCNLLLGQGTKFGLLTWVAKYCIIIRAI